MMEGGGGRAVGGHEEWPRPVPLLRPFDGTPASADLRQGERNPTLLFLGLVVHSKMGRTS